MKIRTIATWAAALALASVGLAQPAYDVTDDSEWTGAITTELTIATGAVTMTGDNVWYTIDTESDAASDDLATINLASAANLRDNTLIVLTSEASARDVTLQDGTGNLNLGRDIVLGTTLEDWVILHYDTATWYLVGTSETVRNTAIDTVKERLDLLTDAFTTSITAFAGGGQGSATAITSQISVITTVPSDGDSVKLPSLSAVSEGQQFVIKNRDSSGDNSVNVFPNSSDALGALADDTAQALGSGYDLIATKIDGNAWDIRVEQGEPIVDDGTNTVQLSLSGDRIFHDTDGDGVKDAGEEFIDQAASAALTYSETFTILEPDAVQGVSDDVILKKFVAESYASGVTITAIHIDGSAAYTSETFLFEHWDDASGTTQATVESIAASAISTEDDGTLSDATIPADYFLVVNLDDTPEDVAYVSITVSYTID